MARTPTIALKIDVRGLATVQAMLRRLQIKHDMPDLLDDIGEAIADRVRESVAAGRTAAGRAAPKPREGGRALFEHGQLLAAVRHIVRGNTVRIGSPVPYAAYLQFGRKGMRPGAYLGTAKGKVVAPDKRTISDITMKFLNERIGHGRVSGGMKARKAR